MNNEWLALQPPARQMAERIIRQIVEPFIQDSRVSDLVRMRFNGIDDEHYARLEAPLTTLCATTRTFVPPRRSVGIGL
jgi:hypothetical protein